MGLRILLAEDETTLRGVISRVLRGSGHEVTAVGSAEEALAAYRDEPFPLVITDIVMGQMTGLELLEQVRILDDETVMVVMTSHASIEAATSALRSGAYDFLIKPFEDLDVITAVVDRAAEKIRLTHENRDLQERLKAYAAELEEMNRHLKSLAVRDGLTGLYNHRYLREALDAELARSTRHDRNFALCFLDIDCFKTYNDTNGHLAGDDLLSTIARILKEETRETTVVARYGGEEFVLLVPEADRPEGVRCAERVRTAIERYPFPDRGSQPGGALTVSVGVAAFPQDGSTATDLLQAADAALYRAKADGKNRVVEAGVADAAAV